MLAKHQERKLVRLNSILLNRLIYGFCDLAISSFIAFLSNDCNTRCSSLKINTEQFHCDIHRCLLSYGYINFEQSFSFRCNHNTGEYPNFWSILCKYSRVMSHSLKIGIWFPIHLFLAILFPLWSSVWVLCSVFHGTKLYLIYLSIVHCKAFCLLFKPKLISSESISIHNTYLFISRCTKAVWFYACLTVRKPHIWGLFLFKT